MDGNERLLSQVLAERSAHGRGRGPGSNWLLLGSLVLVVAVVGILFRIVGTSGVGGVPAPRPAAVGTSAAAAGAVRSQANATSAARPAATTAPQAARRRYVVQAGDSLESIAARAGLSPATLASVNELDDPDLLQPGSELEIPSTDGVLHIVAPGETLRSIALEYNVDVTAVVTANALADPDHIVAGLRLFIPTGKPPDS
ncbi:MAG: LysM peptidoglycan-binding domain-containing protein [Chloroflexi bacterium]|nr:LysM peptidoglycan-binding domain-containing protein [Chloroflexota bacterium]